MPVFISRISAAKVCRNALFSTQPASRLVKVDVDVNDTSLKNEARWIQMPKQSVDTLSFSAGLTKTLKLQMDTLNENCIMVRRPALDVVNSLKHIRPNNPIVRYILYGHTGCGKCTTLHHVLYWAHTQNWMVCYFPRTYIYRRNVKESIQSTWKQNRIDLPEEAALWLAQFRKANEHLLKNPKLVATADYNWSPGESTKAGQPLLDIVNTGASHIKAASDCMAALLKELKHYASTKEIRVLVAIKQMNSLFGPTRIRRADNYYAEPSDVTVMRAILEMLKFDWNNGAVVATIDAQEKDEHLPPNPADYFLPCHLLGREGFNSIEPFVPIEIPVYTREEASSCVDYYIDRHWLIDERAQTEEGREEMFMLTCLNPLLLNKMCSEH